MSDVTEKSEAESAQQPTGSENRRKRFILLVVIPLIAAVIGLGFYLKGGRYMSTENSYVKADVIAVSSRVAGVVVERGVKENASVKAGQLLFRIDDEPYKLAVAKAEANVAEVRTSLLSMKASYRQRQSDLRVAQDNAAYASKEQKRQANLANKRLVAESTFDQVTNASRVATQQISGVEQDLKRIEESLGGAANGNIEQHPSYLAAVAELKQAKLDLDHTRIYAAQNGIVTQPPQIGEFVNVGATAMMLVSTETLWVEANFIETDLTYVRPGQKVEVRIDTYPDEVWEGQVQSLSPATGAEFSVIPAQNATGNWVKIAQRVPVRISIKPNANAPPLQAGLSAEISIDTEHRRSLFGVSL
ncbi:MAG: HlyD family secretion protein [Moraxellaceae bacterium]|nr:MAG: HlyD family secretion protein [Moraxellaceae bacterium]